MCLGRPIKLVLRVSVSHTIWSRASSSYPYVVIVCGSHLKAAVSSRNTATVAIADDVLERVASPPLATIPSNVTLHAVGSSEVVPRSNQVHSLNGGVRLPRARLARGIPSRR